MVYACDKANADNLNVRVVTESLPPYQIVDSEYNITGYSVDIVNLLMEELNIQPEIEIYPWARSYKIAQNKSNVLIFSIDRTPTRENEFHWIGRLAKENYTFFKLKSRKDIQAKNLQDLKQYLVGVSRASSTDQIATKNNFPNLVRVHDPAQLVKMLHAKKVDLVFAIDFSITNIYKENNIDIDLISKVPGLFTSSTDFYIAMSKNTNQEIVEKFRSAYNKLEESGKIKEIRELWGM